MHVSCLVRSRVCKFLEPLRVFEVDMDDELAREAHSLDGKNAVNVRLPRSLATYLGESLAYSLQDFSTRRYIAPPSLPDPCDTIVSTDGLVATAARLLVELRCDSFHATGYPELKRIEWCDSWDLDEEVDSRRVYKLIRDTLRTMSRHVDSADSEDSSEASFSESSTDDSESEDFAGDAQTESAVEVDELEDAEEPSGATPDGAVPDEVAGNEGEAAPGESSDAQAASSEAESEVNVEDGWSSDGDSQMSEDEVSSAMPRVLSTLHRVMLNQSDIGPATNGVIIKVALLLTFASADVADEDREETESRYEKVWFFDTLQKRVI